MENNIQYIQSPEAFTKEEAFVAHIPKVEGKKELLNTIAKKLCFPSHFGENYDALSDCLAALDGINEKEIVIVHDAFPILSEADRKIYLMILNDAIELWKKYENHFLTVIFPIK